MLISFSGSSEVDEQDGHSRLGRTKCTSLSSVIWASVIRADLLMVCSLARESKVPSLVPSRVCSLVLFGLFQSFVFRFSRRQGRCS